MVSVTWSPTALAQFDEIIDWIFKDSEPNARMVAGEIRRTVESIGDNPYIGAMVPEYEIKSLRERVACGYRIIYRVRKEYIEIVTVIRAVRLLSRKPPR